MLNPKRSSAATGTQPTSAIDITVTTAPLRVNSQNEMGLSARRAIPSMTTFALAPTAVRLPPKSAPRASAHHSASGWAKSGMLPASSATMGVMVAT